MRLRQALSLGLVGLAGVVAVVLVFPSSDGVLRSGPPRSGPPRSGPLTTSSAATPAIRPSGLGASAPSRATDVSSTGSTPSAPSAVEVESWQASAPVAQHALLAAPRWRQLADQLDQPARWREDLTAAELARLRDQATSLAMRLERARQPVAHDEVTALLVEEINFISTLNHSTTDADLADQLEVVMQGAHNAIQGAPPPELLAPDGSP